MFNNMNWKCWRDELIKLNKVHESNDSADQSSWINDQWMIQFKVEPDRYGFLGADADTDISADIICVCIIIQ